MIKRFLLGVIICLVSTFYVLADEQKKVLLNNDDLTQAMVELPYCNIIATLKEVDDNDNASIDIELENIQESKIIVLFDRAYSEKELKKQRPSIRYHKIFPGDKGKRIIDYNSYLSRPTYLRPYAKACLCTLNLTDDSVMTCRLPIYIAEGKKKDILKVQLSNNLHLQELEVIELEIHLKLKPDEAYINLTNTYEQLMDDISKETFCKNKNHKGPSCIVLFKKYKDRITEIKAQINAIIQERKYFSTDKKYKMFMEISQKLDTIDFDSLVVESCDNDKKRTGHWCHYCRWSYEQIYKELENIYIDIHNGGKKKESVMSKVEALYNCSTRNKNRKKNDSYKSRIKTYYNKIKSL